MKRARRGRRVSRETPLRRSPGPARSRAGSTAARSLAAAGDRSRRRRRPVRDPARGASTATSPTRSSALELAGGARRAPDRRPRRRRRLAGPRARRGAARTRTSSLVESAVRHCRYLERAVAAAGLDERRGRPRARGGVAGRARRARRRHRPRARRAAGAARVRRAAAGATAACWWPGRARSRAEEAADGAAAAAILGLEPSRCVAVAAVPGRRATARCTCSARSRPRRRASRAGREWPRNARCLRERADAAPDVATAADPPRAPLASGPPWAPSTRSPTRRAGSARPPPRSTSPPASPRPATRRCWSTSTRRATPPSGSASTRDDGPGLYDVLCGDVDGAPTPCGRPAIEHLSLLASTPDLAGATMELPRLPGSETPPARRARAACATRYAFIAARLPAVARPADRQRAGRRRPRDRPGADRVLRARGPRRPARHARR